MSTRTVPWFEGRSQVDRAKLLVNHVDSLRRGPLAGWRREVLHRMRLYTGSWKISGESSATDVRTRFNLVRMCSDTALSVLCASRTLPYCQTRGAAWDVRRQARKRTRALQTQFNRIGVFDQSLMVATDAVVTGLGILHVTEDEDNGGLVGCEREHVLSGVWDPAETTLGHPRQFALHRLVSRDQLAKLYPSKASVISKAASAGDMDKADFQLDHAWGCDLVTVDEIWKLPSASGSEDGLHCIAVSSGMLFEEEWQHQRFPLAFLRGWQPNQVGFPGCSIPELTEEAQRRCDELREFVTQCQHLASGPMLILNSSAGIAAVQPEELTNSPVKVFNNRGEIPPTWSNFEATPQDLQQQYGMIREETLAMLGLNQMTTQGETPSGVESGRAMRTLEEIQSKRHVLMLRHLEGYYLSAAQAICDANDRLAERKPGFEVERETRARWLDSSKWKDLEIKEGEATLAVLPVSALVGSVANQQETLANWVNQGWCDAATAKQLENHPDTEGEVDDENAAMDLAKDQAEDILDGEPAEIDPMVPPQVYVDAFLPIYYQSVRGGAPPEVLDQLRNVLDQSRAAMETAMQMAAPPPAPPGASAPGPAMMQ